jgi:hypothetical protein
MSKTLLSHAENELDLIGLTDQDEMNGAMRKHILHMIEEFSKEGHSGFSANYAISILTKLLDYKPLSPLTGEDSEWTMISEEMSGSNRGTLYQNKRASHVFKDDDGAYDIDGKVFWNWQERPLDEDEEGYPGTHKFKSYYTSRDSRVYVTFPYTPTTVYEERPDE